MRIHELNMRTVPLWMYLVYISVSDSSPALPNTRLVVTFRDSSSGVTAPENVTVVKRYGRRLVLDMHRDTTKEDTDWLFSLWDNVIYVEPDFLISFAAISSPVVPNTEQWNLFGPWGIGLNNFNNSGGGSIAILDDGFANGTGYDFVSDSTLSGDGDGRDSNSENPGICPTNGAATTWHGHQVKTIIRGEPGVMQGIAPDAQLISVRVGSPCGGASLSDIADAIVWSAGGTINGVPNIPKPARVISISMAGTASCPNYLQSAITYATNAFVPVVVAAGNSQVNISTISPAGCVGVISVGANSRFGDLAYYSNFGFTLGAPGGDSEAQIKTMTPSGVTYSIGTSMATPHVAAVIALVGQNLYFRAFNDCTGVKCGQGIISLIGPSTCTAGSYSTQSQGTSCTLCSSGTISPARANVCDICTPDWATGGPRYAGMPGSTVCSLGAPQCIPGWYADPTVGYCLQCPANTYYDVSNQHWGPYQFSYNSKLYVYTAQQDNHATYYNAATNGNMYYRFGYWSILTQYNTRVLTIKYEPGGDDPTGSSYPAYRLLSVMNSISYCIPCPAGLNASIGATICSNITNAPPTTTTSSPVTTSVTTSIRSTTTTYSPVTTSTTTSVPLTTTTSNPGTTSSTTSSTPVTTPVSTSLLASTSSTTSSRPASTTSTTASLLAPTSPTTSSPPASTLPATSPIPSPTTTFSIYISLEFPSSLPTDADIQASVSALLGVPASWVTVIHAVSRRLLGSSSVTAVVTYPSQAAAVLGLTTVNSVASITVSNQATRVLSAYVAMSGQTTGISTTVPVTTPAPTMDSPQSLGLPAIVAIVAVVFIVAVGIGVLVYCATVPQNTESEKQESRRRTESYLFAYVPINP